MNIETLQYFQYIGKYKNITKAAKHFFISQSTLSRHIMSLEEELGVKLFERDNKKIQFTEAGEALYNECELLIRHLQIVINNVQLADKGNTGTLRITSPGKLCKTLSDALILMKEKYPSINLIVESYNFNEIPCAILYGIYNIGFTYDFACSDYDELEIIPVGTDDFSLLIPSKFYKNPSKESIAEIVKSLPLILPTYIEPPFMKLIIHEFQRFAGIKKINTIYVNTTESVVFDVSLGLGYGIVPTSLTKSKNSDENISYINLDDFSAKGTIVMLRKKSNTSEIVNSFVDIIKDLSKKDLKE
ncbi:LysR family transcriptional regulator [Caloramator sp. E03]|uniref:LysR family transcriptional regulator n=1 Tax=Caloramator sp. E03 TaxID=2576307 RepID=UPI00143D9354|nr:LysR family transcriptional regulator [Caloramator sp. E03]